jgi:hypothetical protein
MAGVFFLDLEKSFFAICIVNFVTAPKDKDITPFAGAGLPPLPGI